MSTLSPILFQDDFFVIVHKPSGMLVHRGMGAHSNEQFLVQTVRDQIGAFVYPLHRLDRATSGIVVFALSPELTKLLQDVWLSGQVRKTYQAIVRSWLPELEGVCNESLDDPDNGRLYEAQTRWKVLDTCAVPFPIGTYPEARFTLLELEPTTGRWHQLRRHLSRMKHPIIGDTTHGDRHHNHLVRDRLGWWRLLLAANTIEFPHPITKQMIHIEDDQSNGIQPYWVTLLSISKGQLDCQTILD